LIFAPAAELALWRATLAQGWKQIAVDMMTLHDWYQLFQDQGGFIAGLLTLVAGILAYVAGRVQATATRESARAQVIAIRDQKNQAHEDAVAQFQALERQLEERNREIADMRWKEKVEIVRALATESARLDRFGRDRLLIAESRYSPRPEIPIDVNIAPYQMEAHEVLNKVSVVDFRGTGIMPAATHLNAMVEVLSSALESAGVAGELQGCALIGHLKNVVSSAAELKARLETWEINNPVSQ
jgi:hypothetical protein